MLSLFMLVERKDSIFLRMGPWLHRWMLPFDYFLACDGTVNGERLSVLKQGDFESNGNIPPGCDAATLKTWKVKA